jgi:hypothetical protein
VKKFLSDLKALLLSAEAEETPKFQFAAGQPSEIEVARSGTFYPRVGKKVTFTPDDLAQLASRFDTDREHLLKVGHKKIDTDTADYGRVTAARYDKAADRLFTTVVPTEGMVERNRKEGFRRPSMELSPHKDGGFKIDDIALLGACPPAITGLSPVELAAAESSEGVTAFVFSEEEPEPEKGDPPSFAVVEKEKTKGGVDNPSSLPSEKSDDDKAKEKTMSETNAATELAAAKGRLERFEKRAKTDAENSAKAFFAANVKKIPLAIRNAGGESFLAALLEADAKSVETTSLCFAAGGKEQKLTAAEGFMAMLAALPEQVTEKETKETVTSGTVPDPNEAELAEFAGQDVDEESVKSHFAVEKIVEEAKAKGEKITYLEGVKRYEHAARQQRG